MPTGLLLPLSEGIWAWEPRALELLTASPGDRNGFGLYIRAMPGNNINPCHPDISVQVSAARRAGWGQLQTPRVGCSDGGTFRERLYNLLPLE